MAAVFDTKYNNKGQLIAPLPRQLDIYKYSIDNFPTFDEGKFHHFIIRDITLRDFERKIKRFLRELDENNAKIIRYSSEKRLGGWLYATFLYVVETPEMRNRTQGNNELAPVHD